MIVELHLTPALGHLKMAKLKPFHIQDYYTKAQASGRKGCKTSRGGGLSPRTVAQHHRVLHKALKQAMRLGLISQNPCDMVDPPRYDRSVPATISDKDVDKVLDSVRGTYLYIPVLIALATGARRGEVLGLRWSDVDLEGGTITIRQNLLRVSRQYIIKQPKTADSVADQAAGIDTQGAAVASGKTERVEACGGAAWQTGTWSGPARTVSDQSGFAQRLLQGRNGAGDSRASATAYAIHTRRSSA